MRGPQTRLRRVVLRLIVAGWACCLTSQIGLVQSPFIVNRTPALLGPPQEVEPPRPAVTEFEPRSKSAIGQTLEKQAKPRPQILLFEAREPAAGPSALEFDPSESPPPRFPNELPRLPEIPEIELETADLPPPRFAAEPPREFAAATRLAVNLAPILAARELIESGQADMPPFVALPVSFARPRGVQQDAAAFGRVIGVRGFTVPKWTGDSVRFLIPRRGALLEPVAHFERPIAAERR